MLKQIHNITPECIANRGISGCGEEILHRIIMFLDGVIKENKPFEEITITFETKYKKVDKAGE